MAKIKITDANSKEFEVDLAKIKDINGDSGDWISTNISDAQRSRVPVVRDIKYVDQQGNALDSLQLLKDMSSGKTKILALDGEMEATHSGKNHNYCVYYEDSMEIDAESFMNPFNKPMLKNHNDYSGEPLGRIKLSRFGPSALTDERSAIHLTARVTDADAIPKFLDGRYQTVSIGGSMGTVTCNICGKTILKDGKFNFCGHWRGETYKDQVCYWGARDIDYNEDSTVNNPADDFAQIVKCTVVTDSEPAKKENDNKQEGAGTMGDVNKSTTQTDSKKQPTREDLIGMIDSLLGVPAAATTDAATATAEGTADAGEGTPAATTDAATADGAQSTGEDVEKIKKDLEDAQQQVTDLTQQLKDAQEALQKETEAKDEAKQDADALKDQCISLALANKQLIVDRVVELEIGAGKLTDAQKEDRAKELLSKSMKELNSTVDSLKVAPAGGQARTTTAATVPNPTLANPNESQTQTTTTDGKKFGGEDKAKDTKDKQPETIEDFTKSIIGRLVK